MATYEAQLVGSEWEESLAQAFGEEPYEDMDTHIDGVYIPGEMQIVSLRARRTEADDSLTGTRWEAYDYLLTVERKGLLDYGRLVLVNKVLAGIYQQKFLLQYLSKSIFVSDNAELDFGEEAEFTAGLKILAKRSLNEQD